MTIPLAPNHFRPLPATALQSGRAVRAAKAKAMAGNTVWLYEAILDRAAPPSELRGSDLHLIHEGNGTGRPLAMACTWPRGFLRDAQNPTQPLLLSGVDYPQAVPLLIPAFRYGPKTASCPFPNCAISTQTTLMPIGTLRTIRTRIWARLVTGDLPARLTLAASLLDDETLPGVQSPCCTVSGNTPVLHELVLRLPAARLYSGSPVQMSLRAGIPSGTLLELNDDEQSGAVFGLTSR